MKVKRIVVALVVLAVAGATAFAQTGATGTGRSGSSRYVLTINSNVRGAQVFINAVRQKGTTPMELTLSRGSYSISVRADGYRDYVANINLSRNTTLNATLQPITHNLTVTSSTRGSAVYIDGQRRGNAPLRVALPGGRYTVMVEADGHHPFTQVVNLSRDLSVNAQLQAITFRLNVTSNVQGADVYLNSGMIGKAPVRAEVAPGQYTLRVVASGYPEFSQIIDIQDDFNINVNLRKQVSQVTFSIPASYLNPNVKAPTREITLYIDGKRIPNPLSAPFDIEAGEHLIKLETGAIVVEGRFSFEPGLSYLLEFDPALLLSSGQRSDQPSSTQGVNSQRSGD